MSMREPSVWEIEITRCRQMFAEWQLCLRDAGPESTLTEAAQQRFEQFEQSLRARMEGAIEEAKRNAGNCVRKAKQAPPGARTKAWLAKLHTVRELPTPKKPRAKYSYPSQCNSERVRPTFIGDDGELREIIGLTWNPRQNPIGNGAGYRIFAGGWALCVVTRDGQYFNASLPAMDTDQLAMEIDALRFRMLNTGLFDVSKDPLKCCKWNYPKTVATWINGAAEPFPVCPEIDAHFSAWVAAGEEVAKAKAAGYLHTTRHQLREKMPEWMR